MKNNENITSAVADLYGWIDKKTAGKTPCDGCGDCCNFEKYDHRLFVTAPELAYLKNTLGAQTIKKMQNGICPYQQNNKCTIHKHRFAGCRIFSCKSDTDFQSPLTEEALAKLKSIGTKFDLPYRYMDLATGLNSLAKKPTAIP